MVTDSLCCQLRTLSQKIKTYHFCNPMKLTFCDLLQRISGFIYLYSNTLEDLHQGKKNNDPKNLIAAKVFFQEKNIILNDFVKDSIKA